MDSDKLDLVRLITSIHSSHSMSNVKDIYRRCHKSRVLIGGAGGRRNVRPCVTYAAENSSVFRCALKVVTVAERFVTGDREFQTAGAVILNALEWKLFCYILCATLRGRAGPLKP